MGRKIIEVDEQRIRKIQERIRYVQKQIMKESQLEFANRLNMTIDEYKNRINKSKLPKSLEIDGFLKKISENTPVTLAYLCLEVDSPYETIEGVAESPIKFTPKGDKLTPVIQKLSSDYGLIKALHYFLVELPEPYSSMFTKTAINMYDFLHNYSFLSGSEVFSKDGYNTILTMLENERTPNFELLVLDAKATNKFANGEYDDAIKIYFSALSSLFDESEKKDVSKYPSTFSPFNPIAKKIAGQVYSIAQSPSLIKRESLSPFEIHLLSLILKHEPEDFE